MKFKTFLALLYTISATSLLAETTKYTYIAGLQESTLVDFRECQQAISTGRLVEVSATIEQDVQVQNAYFTGDKLFLVYFYIPEDRSSSGMLCRAFYLRP
jgi:hypothetical protein